MKKNRLLIVIIGLTCIVISIALIARYKSKLRTINQATHTIAGNAVFPRDIGSIHLSEDRINTWAESSRGQILLCDEIGDERNGLDHMSIVVAFTALLRQPFIEQQCLAATADRFDKILVREALHDHFDYDVGPERALERKILLKHNQDFSKLLRDDYALGTDRADFEVIGMIRELRLKSSCPDLLQSINTMDRSPNSFYPYFKDAYRDVCLTRKKA